MSGWGGRREGAGSGGARPGTGPKRRRSPVFYKGEILVLEREEIGGEIYPPQLVEVIGVGGDEIEIQIVGSNEIVVIRRETARPRRRERGRAWSSAEAGEP